MIVDFTIFRELCDNRSEHAHYIIVDLRRSEFYVLVGVQNSRVIVCF